MASKTVRRGTELESSPDSASPIASLVLELGSLSVIFQDKSKTSTDLSLTCGPLSLDAAAISRKSRPPVPKLKNKIRPARLPTVLANVCLRKSRIWGEE